MRVVVNAFVSTWRSQLHGCTKQRWFLFVHRTLCGQLSKLERSLDTVCLETADEFISGKGDHFRINQSFNDSVNQK